MKKLIKTSFVDYLNNINESVKIYGQKSIHLKKIYEVVTEYLIDDIIGEKVDFKVYFRKMARKHGGNIEINDTLRNLRDKKFKIFLNNTSGMVYQFGMLAHEMTHTKQILRGELSVSEDNKYIVWKGEAYITVIELLKIVDDYDFETYKNLPWEKEDYRNQKIYPKKIMDSDTLTKLKGESEQMDYIIDFIY